jgi:PPOX class probable F420-dependent enzyme
MAMVTIPESHQDLLTDEKKAIAFLATTMDDGSPQLTPVWFDTAEGFIRINTARGRIKDRNMMARPKVAITVLDPENIYRYLQIRGDVAQVTEEGAREHIDKLANKYRGDETYQNYKGETRVKYLIKPRSVDAHG